MNRIKATIWTLRAVFAVLVAVVYARRNYKFRRTLVELRRSTRTIDANLSEIKRRREASLRVEQSAAEHARVEFESVDFAVVAKHLQLATYCTRRG